MRGRLYWSDVVWESMKPFRGNSCIGRLDDGTEVEYNLLISDPEPGGDYRFLGTGEFVNVCRIARDDRPAEAYEKLLLNSRFVPEETKADSDKIARIASALAWFGCR